VQDPDLKSYNLQKTIRKFFNSFSDWFYDPEERVDNFHREFVYADICKLYWRADPDTKNRILRSVSATMNEEGVERLLLEMNEVTSNSRF
jgi:hypothetical protein